jgi:predicted nuclease of predicted toxin-antitoxin system
VANFYANENFPLPAVSALRRLGHEVLTTWDSGKTGQAISDEEMLDFARQQSRILLTFNRRHFIRLHLQDPNHAGIVVCSADLDFEDLAHRIHASVQGELSFAGKLLRINRP